jgi:hypothetical protein
MEKYFIGISAVIVIAAYFIERKLTTIIEILVQIRDKR